MLAKLRAWLVKYNWITHSIAVGFGSLTTVYISDPTFQTYVNTTALQLYHASPKWLAQFIVGAAIPIFLTYRKRLTLPGQVSEVNQAIACNTAAVVVHTTGEVHNAASVILPGTPTAVAPAAPGQPSTAP